MAFKHGVYKQEIPTSLIPVVQIEAGLPVIVGTAPVQTVNNSGNVNQVKLVYSYAEAVKEFGFDSDWEKYTLCEFIYSQFALFGMAPAVLINVFDPETHCETISPKVFEVSDSKVNLGKNIVISKGITFASLGEDNADPVLNTDYTLAYDSDNNAVLTKADLADGVHPSEEGYAKLGAHWYSMLKPFLDGTSENPEIQPTEETTEFVEPTEETTELTEPEPIPTEMETACIEPVLYDLDFDGRVGVSDIVVLQKYLLKKILG